MKGHLVRIGMVRLLLNNPLLMIGSTGFVDEFIQIPQDTPSGNVGTLAHVAVMTRGQVAPVEVALWHHVRPSGGSVIFTGELNLPDGLLAVFDVENSTRFTRRTGVSGACAIAIAVDEVNRSSRIQVVLEPTAGVFTVGDVPGFSLETFLGTPERPMAPSTELGLVLSGHDRPFARLVCALKIIIGNARSGSTRAEAINSSRVRMVIEWLRWLSPQLSLDRCCEIGSLIVPHLFEDSPGMYDHAAIAVGQEIWQRIGHQGDFEV